MADICQTIGRISSRGTITAKVIQAIRNNYSGGLRLGTDSDMIRGRRMKNEPIILP